MATTLRRTYVNDLGKLVIEEVIDDGKILVNKKEKLKGGGDFVFVFQQAIFNVLSDSNLSRNALKILLYLIAKTEFEKEINTTTYAIAKELKIDQGTTQRAMNELEDVSIVIRDKVLKKIRLNYEIAFKGSPKNYHKLLHKDPVLLEPKRSNQIDLVDGQQRLLTLHLILLLLTHAEESTQHADVGGLEGHGLHDPADPQLFQRRNGAGE